MTLTTIDVWRNKYEINYDLGLYVLRYMVPSGEIRNQVIARKLSDKLIRLESSIRIFISE